MKKKLKRNEREEMRKRDTRGGEMETEKKMLRRDEMDREGEREKEYATQSARERDRDVFVCVVGGGA